jgi:hypothetical protein
VWERVFQALCCEADNEYAAIDATMCALTNIVPEPKLAVPKTKRSVVAEED